MNAKKYSDCRNTHIGTTYRNIIGGFPHVPGSTMAEKFIYMKEHEDWFRHTYVI